MTPPASKRPFYSEPCLHTYWFDCPDVDGYQNRDKPTIEAWAKYIEENRGDRSVEYLVITCVKKEKKSVKTVLERLRSRFGNNVFQLKLIQQDSLKEGDLWSILTDRLYQSAVDGFKSLLSLEMNSMTKIQLFDAAFCANVNLAIGCELINEPEIALTKYKKLTSDLSDQLRKFAHKGECPEWCVKLVEIPCVSWYCPRLSLKSENESWKLLLDVQSWKASFLELKLFLYTRMVSILFAVFRAWQSEDMCTEILYSTARELKWFKVDCPPCAFECWAYSIARITVLEIMLHLTADVVQNAYLSNSPLLIRVRLWKYAFDKLEALGRKCSLMPNDKAPNTEMIQELLTGLEGQPATVEEETQLVKALSSKKEFSEVFVYLGMSVIGAMKHARRRRMAFHVAKTVGIFQCEEQNFVEAEELLLDICKYCPYEGWNQICGVVYQTLARCQKKLNKMSDYVKTVVKILSICKDSKEEAAWWMQELGKVSLLPHEELDFRNRLKWSPLFTLPLSPFASTGSHFVNSAVEVTVQILYHSSETFKADSVCLILGPVCSAPHSSLSGSRSRSAASSGQQSDGERQKANLKKDFQSMESLDILEEDRHPEPFTSSLTSGDEHLENYVLEASVPQSIRGGDMSHSMSFSSIVGLDENDHSGNLYLTANQVVFNPGVNHVVLSGVAPCPGSFAASQATMSVGNLCFATAVPNTGQWKEPLVVQGAESNITVSIVPTATSALLIGPKQQCRLKVLVEEGSSVPADSRLALTSKGGLHFVPSGSSHSEPPQSSMMLVLPSIGPGEDFETAIDVVVSEGSFKDSKASSNQVSKELVYEVVATYNWLYPVRSNLLLLPAFRSIVYSVSELFTADKSFLQLTMENSCPYPLLLHSQSLTSDVGFTQLHEDMPLALLPQQCFSFLWQLDLRDVDCPIPALFIVNWAAVTKVEYMQEEQMCDFCESRFSFTINSLQTEYVVTAMFASQDGRIRTNHQAQLQFEVKSKIGNKQTLEYEVVANEDYWELLSPGRGTVELKNNVLLYFKIRPLAPGQLPLPHLNLRSPSKTSSSKTKSVYSVKKAECVYVYGLGD
jgi:hypothetical protein